jgi:hypothetical protein
MDGSVTEWNPANGRGKVTGQDGTHPLSSADCSNRLQAVLNNSVIPPDVPVPATYDTAGTGEAINVDLAQVAAPLKALAMDMGVRSSTLEKAAKRTAKRIAKKPIAKRKTAKSRPKPSQKNPPERRPRPRGPQRQGGNGNPRAK